MIYNPRRALLHRTQTDERLLVWRPLTRDLAKEQAQVHARECARERASEQAAQQRAHLLRLDDIRATRSSGYLAPKRKTERRGRPQHARTEPTAAPAAAAASANAQVGAHRCVSSPAAGHKWMVEIMSVEHPRRTAQAQADLERRLGRNERHRPKRGVDKHAPRGRLT